MCGSLFGVAQRGRALGAPGAREEGFDNAAEFPRHDMKLFGRSEPVLLWTTLGIADMVEDTLCK
jgi:hypothetical protein